MQRRNVDLPDPDGPSMHMTSAALDLERDPLEHFQASEALVDALGLDHWLAHPASTTGLPREPSQRERIETRCWREKPRPKRRSMKY